MNTVLNAILVTILVIIGGHSVPRNTIQVTITSIEILNLSQGGHTISSSSQCYDACPSRRRSSFLLYECNRKEIDQTTFKNVSLNYFILITSSITTYTEIYRQVIYSIISW